jgi:hypothetical protein
MSQLPTTDTLERLPARAYEPITELTYNLGQFLQHERQEIDTLACLGAALETHHKVMDELADALARLRQTLFL